MRPLTTTTDRHEAVIERARTACEADLRVRAAWLEGSAADGTLSPWSDIDLHVAVADDEVDGLADRAAEWLRPIGRAHGLLTGTFGPMRMRAMTLEDGVRIDFFVEPVSTVETVLRPVTPVVLIDRDGISTRFRLGRPDGMDVVTRVRDTVNAYFFGYTWPVRLAGREEWGSLLLNALLVVYGHIAPAMLAQDRPEHAYRAHLHNERFLPPHRRRQVDALVAELARAFASLDAGPPDPDAVRAAHERLISMAVREQRAACEATGIAWPADAERALREFYRNELAIEVS